MVGLPYDCFGNPLGAVRWTFEKAVTSDSGPATLDGKGWGSVDLFRDFLFDKGAISQVPVLSLENIQHVQPNSLVRFQGMIQDMPGSEFYVGAYKDGSTWRTNKYMDVSEFPLSSSCDTRIWERRLLYCVPVPGQNSWTESSSEAVVINRFEDPTTQHKEKRRREDDDASIDHMDLAPSEHDLQGSSVTKKMREDGFLPCSSQPNESLKESTVSSSSSVPDFEGNFLPCLVKIYDTPESDLKLNDVFEFVGVLSFDLELDKDDSVELAHGFSEDSSALWPPAKVPRLHCFVHRKLAVQDFLCSSPDMKPNPQLVKGIRESLLGHLTTVLGNDGLAAHFMLLHLLSKVHTRVDTVSVGKLSLNLTSLSDESVSIFGDRVSSAVKNLLPFTRFLPLTVDYLNSTLFAPRKDYDMNRLETGILQLAGGSHLTIDETKLKAGTLNSVGVENARLLKDLIECQKVDYDFKYYKMEMVADVQLLVLSEAKSNILPADVVVPFQPSSVSLLETVAADALNAWRWYLATLRSNPHSIDSEMLKVIEEDLVAARQADRSLGSQDFSRWLTMGRLISASFGENCLSMEHWQMVKELERLRRERLK